MMNQEMLAENVYLVGKNDDRKVPFHRLILEKGTTYNAYLLKTEKPTVIDTVDMEFGREFVEYLSQMIDLKEIQYIVINHTEPDHSGGLALLSRRAPEATIVCTEPAVDELKEMYNLYSRNFLVVKDGDILDIGGKTLKFKETPYLHTKETMVTYCIEDKILFPCDIFSTHVANQEFFADQAGFDVTDDFVGYYQAIIHPHRRYVKTLIDALEELDVQMIAPSHGFILRENIGKYVDLYESMSENCPAGKKAAIVYTTQRNSTKKIAENLKKVLEESHIEVSLFNADKADQAEIIESIQNADAVFIGSSTKYADMIGRLEDVLQAMTQMNLEGKIGAAFGSFGWSGEAIEVIQDYLHQTNMDVQSTSQVIKTTGMTDVEFPVRVRFAPKGEQLRKVEHSAAYVADLLLSAV
jgi:flavorubredoxin